MTTGTSASLTVTVAGATASPFNSEVDLAIDAVGDLLTIDASGDDLIVTGAITFAGGTAALSVSAFTGGAASFVVPDFAGALESEGWVGLETEGGQILTTEGS